MAILELFLGESGQKYSLWLRGVSVARWAPVSNMKHFIDVQTEIKY